MWHHERALNFGAAAGTRRTTSVSSRLFLSNIPSSSHGSTFNGGFRDESLNLNWFLSLAAAKPVIE